MVSATAAAGEAAHDGSAMTASTCDSSASVNFSPAPENTLMPLSSNGLCEAEITTPAVYARRGVRYAMAGVGMIPALIRVPPWLLTPNASSRSIQPPDSRVSRPARNRTGSSPCRSARARAPPIRRTVAGSSGYSPALPRTPSVPNNRAITLLTSEEVHFSRDPTALPDPDSHFHRLHVRQAYSRRHHHAYRELVVSGPQPAEIDRRVERRRVGAHGVASPAHVNRDDRGADR